MPAYSLDDIRRCFSDRCIEDGTAHVEADDVCDIRVGSRAIEGTVDGGQNRRFRTTLHVMARSAKEAEIRGSCSCADGPNCAHAAALALAVLRADDVVALVADPLVRVWLKELDRARNEDDADGYPPRVHQRVWYLLSVGISRKNQPELLAHPVVITLHKDGRPPDRVQPLRPEILRAALVPRYLRDVDRSLLQTMVLARNTADGGGLYRIAGPLGPVLLRTLIETGRSRWQETTDPVLALGPAQAATIAWIVEPSSAQRLIVQPVVTGAVVLPLTPPWYYDSTTGRCGRLITGLADRTLDALLSAPPLIPENAAGVRRELAIRFPDRPELLPRTFGTAVLHPVDPSPVLTIMPAEAALSEIMAESEDAIAPMARTSERAAVIAQVDFDYDGHTIDRGETVDVVTRSGPVVARREDDALSEAIDGGRGVATALIRIPRRRDLENERIRRLIGLGFKDATPFQPRWSETRARDVLLWQPRRSQLDGLAGKAAALVRLLDDVVPQLRAEGWTVNVAPGLEVRVADPDDEWIAQAVERSDDAGGHATGSGRDWFDLSLGVMVDGERIELLPLLLPLLHQLPRNGDFNALDRLVQAGRPVLATLPDGRVLRLPAIRVKGLITALYDLYRLGDTENGRTIRLERVRLGELEALAAATEAAQMRWCGAEQLRDCARHLCSPVDPQTVVVPAGLAATLRPYQRQGLDWLQTLGRAGLGGILADDMGLGKTIQTLAHILCEKEAGRLVHPCLVVAPTSVIVNWRAEAARLAPGLRVLTLHGPDRMPAFEGIAAHDLVLTTYPLLVRDRALLLEQAWHIVVLDEAQVIKNPQSQAAQVAVQLVARQRLCLTGTPLENNLDELWSLFRFLIPGLLGERAAFQQQFRIPIEREDDHERRALLARRVRPFLLRRTKPQVAADLPTKTEIREHIDLGGAQRDLYETIRVAMDQRVRSEVAAKGLARSRIVILDALLKLRQACCDPRLVKLPAAADVTVSAKLDRLMEMIRELVAEGRRILVFSQFTSMLALIHAEMVKAGIGSVSLTGATRDRAAPVARFQAGEVPVFLISLKAGGTGLNLTAADTVIHYDPWWNPAVERQATDRAHRIGQDKPVFVYKLVTVGTVEESILALQARKQALADAILDDDAALTGSFEDAEVMRLFAPLG
ncbi:MAG: DEAD/DEAH box helicase [Azospirillaceae bacterium]|nr:DEAD/DEAH box helicase [Azospirillaceae bacterium]